MSQSTSIGHDRTARARRGASREMHPLLELSKARLTGLVLVTTGVGFLMATHGAPDLLALLWTLLGTGFAAAGANGFNQWIEHRRDARMERTQHRPVPSGRISRPHAFALSLASAVLGVGLLAVAVNLLTAALGALVILLYTLVYTPLKHRTPFCTLVGAVCGAIPPMMGWTGATGVIGYGAWILAALLFLWQIPHFLALAWLYRDDYARGGFRMLPAVDPGGRLTSSLSVVYIASLLPLGGFALLTGLAGWAFLVGSLVLGAGFLALGLQLQRRRTLESARRLFLGSIIYLPVLLALLVADRGPAREMEAVAQELSPVAAQPLGTPSDARPLVAPVEAESSRDPSDPDSTREPQPSEPSDRP